MDTQPAAAAATAVATAAAATAVATAALRSLEQLSDAINRNRERPGRALERWLILRRQLDAMMRGGPGVDESSWPDAPPIPNTLVVLQLRDDGSGGHLWRVVCCPFCGEQHWHGAGGDRSVDPRMLLGGRGSHCDPGGSYVLVEEGAS